MSTRRIIANRFEISDPEKDLLGRGGMGLVYHAADALTGQPVAVKALKPDIVADDPDLVARFVREGEALRQLDHPSIVKMVAAVEEEGQHYLVMEYVEGGSLQDLLAAQGPLPSTRAVEIALDLADALTRAHRLGIIHRDLKPANVLLAQDGTPRLTDFGIAHVADSPRLTETGMLVGTLDYLSPEACQGETLDERTDIWAFGVLLYEMLTGERPFTGNTPAATLLAILTEPVPDLAQVRPEVPDGLADLVYRMLEKDPLQRIPSVRLVGAELEAILKGREIPTPARLTHGESRFATPTPYPPSFLKEEETDERLPPVERPVFVAREQELAQLDEHLNTALGGQGRVVFVTGDAGQGKTTLAGEFARRAQAAHPDLVAAGGDCNAHTGVGDPYLPFREILSLLTGDVEGRWAARAIGREQARRLWHTFPLAARALMEAGPDLIDLFVPGAALVKRATAFTPRSGETDWLPRLEELVQHKAATPGDPSLQQSALFEQYTRVLQALAGQRPLLLVLDDLQWADGGSINLLFHLGRRIEGSRILIVGTYRPADVALGRGGERHPLEPVVNEFKRCFGDIEVDLGQAQDRQFVGALLDAEPNRLGDAFRETLYRQTRGHPLSTVELLRAMQERGDLIQDEEGRWVAGPALDWETLPAQVEAVIAERVGRLAEPAREVLRVASVEGEAFTAEVVARVLGIDEREVVRWLSRLDREHRLVSAQGIRRVAPTPSGTKGGQRLSLYRFRHILFQRYLYNSLGEGERAYLHEDVGTALEDLYGERAEEIAAVAPQLAWHFQEAAVTEKAVDYLSLAGEQARRQYANEEAITYFRRALALLEGGPPDAPRQKTATELHDKLGDVLFLTGQVEEAVGHYQQALALLKERGEHERAARMLMKLGLTFHNAFDFHRSRQAYEEGFALWQRVGTTGPDASLPPAPHALRVAYYDLWSLDPDRAAHPAIDQLFSGLVELSPEMEVLPDVARTWEVLEGGRRYIFHLRDDVRWSDDTPVTAQDFEYSWKRVLDPATEWWGVYSLYDIKGAWAFHQGEAKKAGVGVRALDPLTLAVELEEPTGHFPYILARSITYPVPRHTVEAYGEAWADAANIITNGPFRLETWRQGECIVLVRNPAYHGRFRGNVQRVESHLTSDWHASLEMYEAGGLDVLWINLLPSAELDQARQRHAGEYVPRPDLPIYGGGFNVNQPPFDNVRVRQAFIMAIDREALMDVHMRGIGLPATGGFIPPGMPGHSPGIGLPYDPERARQLMQEAGYPEGGGCGFPIVSVDMVGGPHVAPVCEYVEAQWRENLGVDVTWEKMDLESYRDRLRTDPPHLTLMFWSPGYPDPYSLLRDAVDGARQATGWRNESYDQLVEKARRTMDSAERLALYQQADRMLIEEAAIWPITHGRTHLLVKPWVSNLPASPGKWWYWKDVVIEPH